MRFIDLINDVQDISLVTSKTDMVKRALNQSLSRAASYRPCPYWLWDAGIIRTVAPYSAGKLSITSGLNVCTGSILPVPTAWNSTMNLGKIRISTDPEWYRIGSVNAVNNLSLVGNYPNATRTNVSYQIYKDEYFLAPDVMTFKNMRNMKDYISLFDMPVADYDEMYPNPTSTGGPVFEILVGTAGTTFNYSTGTVTGVATSTTLTGVGTAFMSTPGIGRMSQITLGTDVYDIAYINSDLSLTLFQPLKSNYTGVYSILINNLMLQLGDIPDSAQSLYYRYYRLPSPMVNDYDVPDMPPAWHWILMYGALSIMFMQKGDLSKSQIECEARFVNGVQEMINSYSPDRIYKKKSIDRIKGRILDGLERSSFDVRYSRP